MTSESQQAQLRINYMNAVQTFQRAGTGPYHKAGIGLEGIQRENLVSALTNNARNMTPDSKAIVFNTMCQLTEEGKIPDYTAYWLLSALGGDGTTPMMKREMLNAVNEAVLDLTGNNVRAYLGKDDKELLKVITTDPQEKDSKERVTPRG
ncbi:hypothetical protein IT418_03550 [bacterium]|nr:hypothetical protein [bacterium]